MKATLELVTGGIASGKSAWAEQRIVQAAPEWAHPHIITPCDPQGMQMEDRVHKHRVRRNPRFITVERFDLATVITELPDDTPVLVDALDTWLAQIMHDRDLFNPAMPMSVVDDHAAFICQELVRFAAAARKRHAITSVIAGVPGFGLVPTDKVAARSIDLHGMACQALQADYVWLIHAGRPIAQG